AVLVGVVWISLAWTAVKPEYRTWVSGYTLNQTTTRSFNDRISFIARRILFEPIDYDRAVFNLLRRIGYTEIYAEILARLDAGAIAEDSRKYLDAVQHVVMPRVLFPDKAKLDDSAVTTALTGREIEEGTSISVGYVAEAHVDFGFPAM